ncbi:ATP-binding protein [Nocardiopsis sp. MG754419]|uniref:ATP-binding protein n=1 Tax=Nocardiopsis sp. MG754419 TaxID=2259865 RepID=UPI001BADEC92|nr:ATP-binding protein [Nocardiopsis sp. MG754419]MBR8744643.1 chromosome segregation protein SMC [Nocardiopsis sp. MG754419]
MPETDANGGPGGLEVVSGNDDPTAQALLEALAGSGQPAGVRAWVNAALWGEEALEALLQGEHIPEAVPDAPSPGPSGRVRRAYLTGIRVQGFRGIGRPAELSFRPGPGLTVIVGRNGSGKSSFAEAAEAALTGRNPRWDAMPTGWRDGWRNLHYDERTEASVDIHIAGDHGPTRISRRWAGESVRSARGEVVHPSGEVAPLRTLDWGENLVRYRPFLSYDELGRTVTGRAAELYDTLTALLGLTGLAEAERRLAKICDGLARRRDRPSRNLPPLMDALGASGDPRAAQVRELLSAPTTDLEALRRIAADDGPSDPTLHVVLRRLRRLNVPERVLMSDVVNELRGAAMELAMAAGSKGDHAHGVVRLLEQALEHHKRHPTETTCPTCATSGSLGPDWVRRANAQLRALRPQAAIASAAYDRADAARDQARFLVSPMPTWLPPDSELGQVWALWESGSDIEDLAELADHIEAVGRRLRAAAVSARRDASERLEDPTNGWSDLAERLSEWLDDAQDAVRAAETLAAAEAALDWLAEYARSVRVDRLGPVASQAEQVWFRLRQERHIDLQGMRLIGRGARRRVEVDVTVDGVDDQTSAPGLLSQGEFQALALSICLPRTLVEGNPFGFLLLDDPVQAMDTETVEGLAAVLAEVGRHRQLIVFTHDTRLSDALRRLGLPADIRTINRDAMSNVWLAENGR